KLTLKRVSKSMRGVFGVLLDEYDHPFAVTAERPDLGNASNISCIPEGTYKCAQIVSPSKGSCIQVTGVAGRDHILMHKGNYPLTDSQGCILVGESYAIINNVDAVGGSRLGFGELMRLYDEDFILSIENVS
ncbi:MAG: DUF5675 family protein, partial [Ghiorsea sp.]